MATTKKTKAMLLEEIANLKEKVERLDRYSKYEEGANEMYSLLEAFMNSGFTRQEAFTMALKMIDSAALMMK